MEMTKLEATLKARTLLLTRTIDEFASELGISKVTLYSRFAKNNWKRSEIFMLEKLKQFFWL